MLFFRVRMRSQNVSNNNNHLEGVPCDCCKHISGFFVQFFFIARNRMIRSEKKMRRNLRMLSFLTHMVTQELAMCHTPFIFPSLGVVMREGSTLTHKHTTYTTNFVYLLSEKKPHKDHCATPENMMNRQGSVGNVFSAVEQGG